MFRQRENSVKWVSGMLSLLVHGLFVVLLVMSFSWKSIQPMQVVEVELWDSIPAQKVEAPPAPAEPVAKVEPQPEPPPPPPPESKAEIRMKDKPLVKPKPEKKPKPEAPKPDPRQQAREEEKRHQEELKRLQQQIGEDDRQLHQEMQNKEQQKVSAARNADEARKAALASSGEINDAMAKIRNKIYRYVNRDLCGTGKPVLKFSLSLIPTGELEAPPRLLQSSGISACDQAISRAILQAAHPLPLPTQPELLNQFRDLILEFRPNDQK
ncbi:transport protein TonB [mine drainage metagenome]|uniref:Transport protein TonB n=1 Tax=mine drainage metagenome TaxID=410659 RepID=A0A1J5RFX4_9ZZZZ